MQSSLRLLAENSKLTALFQRLKQIHFVFSIILLKDHREMIANVQLGHCFHLAVLKKILL